MDWLLHLLPGGGILSFAFDAFGGWEWLLGAAGGPITIAAVFLKKWKWVALAIGVAAIALWIMSLYLGLAHRDTRIAELSAAAQRAAENYAECQRLGARNIDELTKIKRHAVQDLAAVTKAYERRLAAQTDSAAAREIIHDAAKECIGSAAAYRAALDRLRGRRAAAAAGDDGNSGGPGRATGGPVDLQGRAADAGGQPRRRGQRRLVLRRHRGGRRLPQDARGAAPAVPPAVSARSVPCAA